MPTVFATIGLIIWVISSCGKISGKSKAHPDGWYPAPTDELAMSLFNDARVTCEDAGNCNPSVGLLVARHQDGVSICTAFLTGPSTVYTNSHCVPEDLKKGDSCEGKMEILFPATQSINEVKTSCKSVSLRSNHELPNVMLSQDIAILELKSPVERSPLGISLKAVESGEEISIVSMNPSSNSAPVGTISLERKCTAIGNTMFNADNTLGSSPILFFSDCKVISGNSGSPLIDSNGLVRAVGQANFRREKLASILKPLLIEDLGEINAGTALNCVDLNSETVMTSCKPLPKTENIQSYMTSMLKDDSSLSKKLSAQIDAVVNDWNKSYLASVEPKNTNYIYWKPKVIKMGGTSSKLVPVPSCLRDPTLWVEDKFVRGLFGFPRNFSESFRLPQFLISIGLNKYLEFESRVNELLLSLPFDVIYNPNRFDSSKVTLVDVKIDSATIHSEKVKACGAISTNL